MKQKKIKAYKALNKDLTTCYGFQYEIGKEYEEEGSIKACEKGFHACPYPMDIFSDYPPSESRFCEVEMSGQINKTKGDKICSSKIKINAELDIRELVKAAVNYVKERCVKQCNAGDSGAATAGASGAATAGARGAATAGDYGTATARGKASTGENGLSVARGSNVQVKGGIGSVLVIAEEKENTYDILSWKATVVDGQKIKADTWYRLHKGEFVEVD